VTKQEQRNISGRIRNVHGFINYIGVIDGTLFPLAFATMVNGEDYFTRKGDYSITVLVICDNATRITWINWDGWAVYTTIEYGQTVRYRVYLKGISWMKVLQIEKV